MEEGAARELEAISERLKERLCRHAPRAGDWQTAVDSMVLLRREADSSSEKTFERPLAAFVIQGSKLSCFGGREYFYRENQCLVAGIDMPASFRAMPATADRPFLSVFFYLDPKLVSELCAEMAQKQVVCSADCEGVKVADTDPELLDTVLRLVGLLDRPEQIPVRAPMLLRELHCLLLMGPYGTALRQLNTQGTDSNQALRAIDWLRGHFAETVRTEELARMANMSASSLHRRFKQLTGLSPIQYQKQLRLYEAQRLMLLEGSNVSSAAFQVGYESVTQFSREYRTVFGEAPSRDIARLKQAMQTAGA
ncbi:MAG: AraC family transcriptional regulator [Desulfovibrionaceae bacterium]|nr:AraC family transcriptional regulator [Desulfovibrionaceae bacterium]